MQITDEMIAMAAQVVGLSFTESERALMRETLQQQLGAYQQIRAIGLPNDIPPALTFAPHIGVLNVFDRDYITSVTINAFGGRFFEPGPPRSLYGGLIARF